MLVSKGNHKIGKDTLILNITSATDCPSRALGLCQVPGKCYAMKAERMYPQVLPYRRKQTEYWDQHNSEEIARDLADVIKRSTKLPIKYIRISESGDFRYQEDVTKLVEIAEHLVDTGVVLYCYTARKELDFSKAPANLVVNGSAWMADNSFTAVPKKDLGKYQVTCPGNCRICSLCKTKAGLDIKVGIH